MVREIQHYHKKLRRHAIDGVTTRNILLEETAGVIQVIISEVRPTKDRDGFTIGYHVHPVSQQWFLTFEEAISAAEVAFNSGLDSGFREVNADTGVSN
jgi:hypothetical protein